MPLGGCNDKSGCIEGTHIEEKKISDFIPSRTTQWTVVQARVDLVLARKIRKIIEAKRISWNTLISACLKRYLFEVAPDYLDFPDEKETRNGPGKTRKNISNKKD